MKKVKNKPQQRKSWNEKTVLDELKSNKNKNYNWFKSHASGAIYWASKNGGWEKWATKAGVKIERQLWNEDRVKEELEAHSDKPMTWFYKNRFGMMLWIKKNGGAKAWRKKVGIKMKRDIDEAFVLDFFEKNKDKLENWFRRTKPSVVRWCEANGGWDHWVEKMGIQYKTKWDKERVIKCLKENKSENFNYFKNYFPGLVRWCSLNGGFRKWATEIGIKNVRQNRSESNVIAFMKKHKDKDLMWFIKNEPSLTKWCYNHGGLKKFAIDAGVINAEDYEEDDIH